MKKSLVLNILQLLFVFIILIIFKTQGYTWAAIFGQPSVYFYFILPFAVTMFFFGITFIITTKEMNWYEKTYALITTIILAIMSATGIWIYVTVGTSLQIFVYVVVSLLVLGELVWFVINTTRQSKVQNNLAK